MVGEVWVGSSSVLDWRVAQEGLKGEVRYDCQLGDVLLGSIKADPQSSQSKVRIGRRGKVNEGRGVEVRQRKGFRVNWGW